MTLLLGVIRRAELAFFELLLHMPDERGRRPCQTVAQRVWEYRLWTRRVRRANGVAFPADNKASDVLLRLLEVLPCG